MRRDRGVAEKQVAKRRPGGTGGYAVRAKVLVVEDCQDLEHSRLVRAVGSDETHKLTGSNCERHIPQSLYVSVTAPDSLWSVVLPPWGAEARAQGQRMMSCAQRQSAQEGSPPQQSLFSDR